MTTIELDNVCMQFGDGNPAVSNAHFSISEGEFFVLVGPSGCGKSTLLNLIVGLETPTSGEIRINGKRANEIDARDRNMAMVFQSYAIYPHMSVRENLAFPLKIARLGQEEIERRVREAADMLELGELLDRRPASLSGGQRQRVAMGRAIVREPAAFLLDEPLSNLDARLRQQMRVEIARLQKRLGVTTIYVTHDQHEAMTLGDRIAVMRDGVVQQIGTPKALYEQPENIFVAGFVGSPAINLLPASFVNGRLETALGAIALTAAQAAAVGEPGDMAPSGLTVGIRPEAFTLPDAQHPTAFEAKVELVEWTGAERLVHFYPGDDAAGDTPAGPALIARLAAESEAEEGQLIRLAWDPDRALIFESETGRRIRF